MRRKTNEWKGKHIKKEDRTTALAVMSHLLAKEGGCGRCRGNALPSCVRILARIRLLKYP